MTVKELRKIIETHWDDDFYEIADKLKREDLLKLCDQCEGNERMYVAIRECIRVLHPKSEVRLRLEKAIEGH